MAQFYIKYNGKYVPVDIDGGANNGNYQNSNNRNNNSSNGNYNNSSKKNKGYDPNDYQCKCGAVLTYYEVNDQNYYYNSETNQNIPCISVNAWFISKGQKIEVKGFTSERSKEYYSEPQPPFKSKGYYYSMLFNIKYCDSGVEKREIGFFYVDSGCVYLKDTGILINTKKKNKRSPKGWAGFWYPNKEYNK